GPATELRHLGSEKEIRRTADGNGVQARVAQIASQSCEDLLFVAEIAVSEKDNVAQISGGLLLPHEMEQSGQHLSAAACLKVAHVAARGLQILRRSRLWLESKFVIVTAEGENPKAVAGPQTVERLQQGFASLLNGGPLHRAGDINHVEHLDGYTFCGLDGR